MTKKSFFKIISICLFFLCAYPVAARMNSANFQINADVLSGGGDVGTSTNYRLSDTVSESVVGTGSSTQYIVKDGFWQMVNSYLFLSVDATTVGMGTITPGTPVTGTNTLSVITDAWNGYTLSVAKDHRLRHTTDSATEIVDHGGTLTTPQQWSGGYAQGFGMTLTNGSGVDAKWGTVLARAYAGIPNGVSQTFHTKNQYQSTADATSIEYKLDVPGTQKSGAYAATITYTAIAQL